MTPSAVTSEPEPKPDPHRGWKRALAAGHVLVGAILIVAWLLMTAFWAVYVLGDNCFEGPCSFSHTEKTVAIIQAVIAAPGLIALGFALVQGARYTARTEASEYTRDALKVAGGVLAGWILFMLGALFF